MRCDQRYRKDEHLRLRADFARVFRNQCTAADDVLVVHVAKNDLSWSRLGVSVSKRIGTAVCRNSIRRRIREAFRTSKANLPDGFDIVCVARPKAKDTRCDVARSLCVLAVRAARHWMSKEGKTRTQPDRNTNPL